MKTESDTRFLLARSLGLELHYVEQAESTNSVMAAGESWPAFSVVLTEEQTAGRGRLGRTWISRPGESLALSVMVPALRHSPGLAWIPLLAGACLVEALRSAGLPGVGLKWPNDVLVGGKKLAGVLCEVHPNGGVIVGIGLNLRFLGEPPSENAAALSKFINVGDGAVDLILAGFIELLRTSQTWKPSDARTFVSDRLLSVNRAVDVVPVVGESWRGVARGVNREGHLIVRNAQGEDVEIVAADVHHLFQ
jgi:BirA family biotin operon repressor/biotin-[acetyl-CoA-carboxylase] ligase